MTKLEYLAALTQALSFLDRDVRNAALDFYREALEDRIEEAGSEEAAMAAMEPPEKIAADLRREMEAPVEAASRPDDGLSDEWSERTFECSAGQLRAARLEAENMAIEVLPGEGDRAHLTYYTRRQDVYAAKVDGDVLTLSHRSEPSLARRLLQGLFYRPVPVKVTLLLPPDAVLDLSAETKNGSVTVKGMQGLGVLNMKSSNGSLTAESAACGEAVLRTSNAWVAAKDFVCRGDFQARSSNGSLSLTDCGMSRAECVTSNAFIRAENVQCGDTLRLETNNGSVQAQGVRCAALSLRSSNAFLTVGDVQAESVSLHTSNGSIRGVLPGRQRDWKIDSGTFNGKNSLPASQPGEKPLSVRTGNASIQITFEGGL